MGFSEVFSKSWKNYKDNFGTTFKFMLLFYALPFLVYYVLIGYYLGDVSYTLSADSTLGQILGFLTLGIALALITAIASIGIVASALKKDKFNFSDAMGSVKKFYWKYIFFMIIVGVLMILLFMALVIPGIIFAIYWVFGIYVLIDEGKGISKSLGRSFQIVRHRWWRTLGNLILYGLIVVLVSIVFGIPSVITASIAFTSGAASWANAANIVSVIMKVASAFVTLPLGIFFIKNLYLAFKKEKNK